MKIDVSAALKEVMELYRTQLRAELRAQGHFSTGKLSDSIEYEISAVANLVVGRMFVQDYGEYVERGVKAGDVPYAGGRGRGGTSRYIEGLIGWWQEKGLGPKEAKSAAFATANKHRVEGIPSRNSYGINGSNGERKNFVARTLNANESKVIALITRKTGTAVQLAFTQLLGKYPEIK